MICLRRIGNYLMGLAPQAIMFCITLGFRINHINGIFVEACRPMSPRCFFEIWRHGSFNIVSTVLIMAGLTFMDALMIFVPFSFTFKLVLLIMAASFNFKYPLIAIECLMSVNHLLAWAGITKLRLVQQLFAGLLRSLKQYLREAGNRQRTHDLMAQIMEEQRNFYRAIQVAVQEMISIFKNQHIAAANINADNQLPDLQRPAHTIRPNDQMMPPPPRRLSIMDSPVNIVNHVNPIETINEENPDLNINETSAGQIIRSNNPSVHRLSGVMENRNTSSTDLTIGAPTSSKKK